MKFDNNKALFNVMVAELITPLVWVSLTSIAFLDVYKNNYLPLENYQYALIITLLFLTIGYFWYGQKKSYFSLDTDSNIIIIKYFHIRPKFFKPKPKLVKIPKSTYVKYKIEKSFYGLRSSLFLFQKTKQGVVKYPPIYISSLNTEELEKLKLALQY